MSIAMEITSAIDAPKPENMPPLMADVFEFWQRLGRDGLVPGWSGFRLDEMPLRALPWCAVMDVHLDPLDFIYRFFGTARRHMQGREYTGQSVRSLEPQKFADKAFHELRTVYERKAPFHVSTVWSADGAQNANYDILRVPFCGDDNTVTQILTLTIGGPNFHRIYEAYGTQAPLLRSSFNI